MNDKWKLAPVCSATAVAGAFTFAISGPALAGEAVLYEAAPDWTATASLDEVDRRDGPSNLIFDWQHRLEDGVVTSYEDTAIRIDNPEALMEQGTISLTWFPDKGDLSIHKVEILRGDEIIDVVDGGARFDVIRREQGLEQRLFDGQLTATLAVPGLKVGDILRVTHSTTMDDQALGEEMQASQYLWTKPWQVDFSRVIVSWPVDEEVFWSAENKEDFSEPLVKDGFKTLTLSLPIEEKAEMPHDAPARFRRPTVLRVGTYADWNELSRSFAPHYVAAAKVPGDSAVADEARRIMAASDDPLTRVSLALRLVQDDVSYLLNGLDGGNYMPQAAELTWDQRYGDCKAKSVLLYSLLTQMEIDAEPVLVVTSGGDALPELLPIPGNFDHMIVRAKIDGKDYWLDGTSTATRLANLADVPPFFYALPLTAEGSDLVEMEQRELAWPQMIMQVDTDYSAGVDLPPFFDLTMKIFGPQGAGLRAMADEGDEEALKTMAAGFASSAGTGGAITNIEVSYDEQAGAGIIEMQGIAPNEFEWRDGRLRLSRQNDGEYVFNPDRARAEWRQIPVQTSGPSRVRMELSATLPENMGEFTASGPDTLDSRYANTSLKIDRQQSGRRVQSTVEVVERLGEIAPEQIATEKLAARRLNSVKTDLVAPEAIVWRWDLEQDELARRTAPIIAAYDEAVEFAADDDHNPLIQRARFRTQIFDWGGALRDIDTLLAEMATADMYRWRAEVLASLGRTEEAIDAAQTSYDLDPDNVTAFYLAELLAYDGQREDALAVLEALPIGQDESGQYASTYATVAGLAGKTDDAFAILGRQMEDKPTDASVLNADCWFRGLFNVGLDTAMPVCTKAIERATNSAPMLDSRAMVNYRLGDLDAAMRDLDSALELVPGLAASRYLRGIIRLESGDTGGRDDVATALRISPELAERYAVHGLSPRQ